MRRRMKGTKQRKVGRGGCAVRRVGAGGEEEDVETTVKTMRRRMKGTKKREAD
jgi:hypothetical protein